MLQRDEEPVHTQLLTCIPPWRTWRSLQDSKLPSLFPRKFYLDLVDDDWIADTLSDDGACGKRMISCPFG